ncbi:hypothetical protein SZN_09441 [Streptomyces zinciresistens K42]|uniref:Transcriptional regulator WhiB n=1 Tax=Streptomyces zinciresistens K42 TaxID=700597 RepID=G2G8S0_9ACTN|nr:WhiB family transcriptional regulator [Streptomyces zinciresistens]EGX60135.1 hypothetical protein SZN_09441 [Streptomyces zinciresistens K42]
MSPADSVRWHELTACSTAVNRPLFLVKSPGAEARAVCQSCPVRAECLHDALVQDTPNGLWGGLTHAERRALPPLPDGRAAALAVLRERLAPAAAVPAPEPDAPRARPARAATRRRTPTVKAKPKPKPGSRNAAKDTAASQREGVAAMLRAGATHRQIMDELHVTSRTITETRTAYAIPYRQGPGFRYSPQQRAQNEQRTLELLRAGASYSEITEQVGISAPAILKIRRAAGLKAPARRPPPPQTRAQALAARLEPYGDGHARWTGTWSGRMPQLYAEKGRFNARHTAFEQHHGRPPAGYVRSGCTEGACMAGAHLTDDLVRAIPVEEAVTVHALRALLSEIDQQGGPQAARDNLLDLTPASTPREPVMPTADTTSHPSHTAQAPAGALPLPALLAWGDSHPDSSVQDQAARARAAVEGLRARHAADQELTAITDEAAQLEKRLAELRAREAELAPKKPRRSPPPRDYDARTVRAWAVGHGVDCPGVGQIPKRVLDAWRAAGTSA